MQKLVGATQDRAIGPKTLQAVMNHDPAELIDKLHDTRQKFYQSLSHFKTYGKGWTRRNREMLALVKKVLRLKSGEALLAKVSALFSSMFSFGYSQNIEKYHYATSGE